MNYFDLVTAIEPKGWKEIGGMNCRTWYHVGAHFVVEIVLCEHDRQNRYDLVNLWKRHGYTNRFYGTTAHVHTYYTDIDGICSGLYNVQELHRNGRAQVDFDYMCEATPENIKRLVSECIRMREMDIRK